jgi:hypothetical protein
VTLILDAALANLLSPPILFFVLGLLAGWVRSDLEVPDAIAKALALYLILAIGFKGGAAMAESGELMASSRCSWSQPPSAFRSHSGSIWRCA